MRGHELSTIKRGKKVLTRISHHGTEGLGFSPAVRGRSRFLSASHRTQLVATSWACGARQTVVEATLPARLKPCPFTMWPKRREKCGLTALFVNKILALNR